MEDLASIPWQKKCVDRGEKVVPLQVGPVLDGHTKKMNDMNFGDIYGQFYNALQGKLINIFATWLSLIHVSLTRLFEPDREG